MCRTAASRTHHQRLRWAEPSPALHMHRITFQANDPFDDQVLDILWAACYDHIACNTCGCYMRTMGGPMHTCHLLTPVPGCIALANTERCSKRTMSPDLLNVGSMLGPTHCGPHSERQTGS